MRPSNSYPIAGTPRIVPLTILFTAVLFFTCLPAQASEYNRAVSLFEKRDYSGALALFEKARKNGDNEANSAYYEALCYHHLGKMDQAKAAYTRVINNYPHSKVARLALTFMLKIDPDLRKKHQEAIESIKAEGRDSYSKLPEEVSVKYKKSISGHMLVPVKVNGVSTEMMLDTGAGVTYCRRIWLDAMGIKPDSGNSPGMKIDGVGGEIRTSAGLVTIEIGNLSRTTPIYIEEKSKAMKTDPFAFENIPLLGQNFFQDFICEIDDKNQILRFKKTDAKKASGRSTGALADNEVPFFREGNNIVVTVKINGRECEMFFDTGANALSFADRHLAGCGLNRPTSARSSQAEGVGGQKQGFQFYVDSVSLGPIEKHNVGAAIMINSRFSRPLLGQTFLSGLKYTIDPTRNVIIFE
ncbi:MAG: retroviral-like aspartic protease family protein [Candidatus Obscuribacterales bacterium]